VSAADPVVVRCLSSGAVRGKNVERGPRRYLPGGWAKDTLPVNFFLLEHGDGLCLFDTGQSARAAGPGYISQWHPFLRLARFELTESDEAAPQLRALGHDPAQVRWVVLSHLHTDHVGGVAPFRDAEVIVTRTEWERFGGLGGRIRGYLPQHWPADLEPTLVELDGPPIGPLAGSFDLAGDGSLLLVPLPGHTAGHIGLLAKGRGASYLLGGDAAHSAHELADIHPRLDEYCRHHEITPLLSHDPAASSAAVTTRHGRSDSDLEPPKEAAWQQA
jgi:N-acyl homoserine lactone hydrolase